MAPGQGRQSARRHRHPEVLADLGVDHEPRHVLGREQEVRPERGAVLAEPDLGAVGAGARGEMAALVELAVVRQVDLGHHAEQPAAVRRDRRVVEAPLVAQGRAEQEQRRRSRGAGHELDDGALDRVEQRVLQEQIVDRVAREGQLGEHGHRGADCSAHSRANLHDGLRRSLAGSASVQRIVQTATRAKPCRHIERNVMAKPAYS